MVRTEYSFLTNTELLQFLHNRENPSLVIELMQRLEVALLGSSDDELDDAQLVLAA